MVSESGIDERGGPARLINWIGVVAVAVLLLVPAAASARLQGEPEEVFALSSGVRDFSVAPSATGIDDVFGAARVDSGFAVRRYTSAAGWNAPAIVPAAQMGTLVATAPAQSGVQTILHVRDGLLRASRFANGRMGDEIALDEGAGGDGFEIASPGLLAVETYGTTAVVLWVQSSNPGAATGRVRIAYIPSWPEAGPVVPTLVATFSEGDRVALQRPLLAIAPDGTAVASWTRDVNGTSQIRTKRFIAGTISAEGALTAADASTFVADLVVSNRGRFALAWVQGSRVWSRTRLGDAAWSSAQPISGFSEISAVRLVARVDGSLLALWDGAVVATPRISARTWVNGAWGTTVDVGAGGLDGPDELQAVALMSGDVVASWTPPSGSAPTVAIAREHVDSGVWRTQTVATRSGTFAADPALQPLADGRALLLWRTARLADDGAPTVWSQIDSPAGDDSTPGAGGAQNGGGAPGAALAKPKRLKATWRRVGRSVRAVVVPARGATNYRIVARKGTALRRGRCVARRVKVTRRVNGVSKVVRVPRRVCTVRSLPKGRWRFEVTARRGATVHATAQRTLRIAAPRQRR